jgi:hypothetical protein
LPWGVQQSSAVPTGVRSKQQLCKCAMRNVTA